MFAARSLSLALLVSLAASLAPAQESTDVRRLLYVASPGVRNYVEWGGHGVLVFDIDDGHRFLRRISLDGYGLGDDGRVLNVKGVCANSVTDRLYVSTLEQLICVDLKTDEVLWQRAFDKGCDRMSLTPDGAVMYLPSLEKDVWYVVDAASGEEIKRIAPDSRAHNTVVGLDGSRAYLAGLGSPLLTVVQVSDQTVEKTVGPFSNYIRPFTVNGAQTRVYVNINELLGFEIGDLTTGEMLHRVEVSGFPHGAPKRHGCPSHGIGLTPDETEIWLCDGFNSRLHIFDATADPPEQVDSIPLREQPGWVTFTISGDYAYASTGEVIDVATRQIVAALSDEEGRPVHSEKVVEVDFAGGEPVAHGDQFGLGRVLP